MRISSAPKQDVRLTAPSAPDLDRTFLILFVRTTGTAPSADIRKIHLNSFSLFITKAQHKTLPSTPRSKDAFVCFLTRLLPVRHSRYWAVKCKFQELSLQEKYIDSGLKARPTLKVHFKLDRTALTAATASTTHTTDAIFRTTEEAGECFSLIPAKESAT